DRPFEGAPLFRLTNTCKQGRYRIEKVVLANPRQHAALQAARFTPLQGSSADYRLYALLAPLLGNRGNNTTAWADEYKGTPMLFARREDLAVALACSVPWRAMSVGFAGTSDGWHDLEEHKRLTTPYDRAEDGCVALTGEVDLGRAEGRFVLALGLGRTPDEAAFRALASLNENFEALLAEYVREWQDWQRSLRALKAPESAGRDLYRISTAVLRTHETKSIPGGIIASLSVPWGFAHGDDNLGGYHLVWPRDLVEAAGGLLAAGGVGDAHRKLAYLQAVQEADGHWAQNIWVDGHPYWNGVQLDETALPILLFNLMQREGKLDPEDRARFWPMIRAAAGYLVRLGPATEEDRWEKDAGYTPFTLAAEIAALLVAADLADANHEPELAGFLRETADAWNASIETWLYVTGTELARRVGVAGYYMRIVEPATSDRPSSGKGSVTIKNRPPGDDVRAAVDVVSPDVLALVRFGLRAPDDPRIVDTVKVLDSVLKIETPFGPCWRRYTHDGYGEHEDGSPFDGTGIGRAWPLLTGERAHYELAAGRRDEAERLLRALGAFAGDGGMIPEQVWDAPDIPERALSFGRPSGSAMPLAWAHAEYVKLLRSLHDGRVFDTPHQTTRRYLVQKTGSALALWRFNKPIGELVAGKALRLLLDAPGRAHWSADGWRTARDVDARDTGVGVHAVDLPTAGLAVGTTIEFTLYWPDARRWEGTNFAVTVREAPPTAGPDPTPPHPRKEDAA
ncbi:MAG: glycoside hydrolase family 15 protein, partial [Planctomycetaceae bacterium]